MYKYLNFIILKPRTCKEKDRLFEIYNTFFNFQGFSFLLKELVLYKLPAP